MTKHVTLFGRKMRKTKGRSDEYTLGHTTVRRLSGWSEYWRGWYSLTIDDSIRSDAFKSPHAAARALERKIVAAHRRLGKLIEGKKGREK